MDQAETQVEQPAMRPMSAFAADMDRMFFQSRLQGAERLAAAKGEPLRIPTDWATVDMPESLRERLAALSTEASVGAWEQECASETARARVPFERFAKCVCDAVPKRYADARPLPPAESPQSEPTREMLRRRVKSREAYKATIAAARGIADGSVRQVLFIGASGAGKSTLAAILLHAVADQATAMFLPKPALPARPAPFAADDFLYRPKKPDPLVVGRGRQWTMATRERTPPGWKRLGHAAGFHIECSADRSPVQWATARDVFRLASNPPRPKFGEEADDPLGVWKRAPLLVLDDIGGEPEQRNIEAVDGILWHRHDADDDVVTITTTGFFDEKRVPTNMDRATEEQIVELLAPLTTRYGAALVRRIAEPGQTVVIPVIAGRP